MSNADIIVAGHICLDLIPEIPVRKDRIEQLLVPGRLLNVGPVVTSSGGAVANCGVALHKLGEKVRLIGKVGADAFGDVIRGILRHHDTKLADGMIVDESGDTSYTMVISPPGIDRIFLHHPGANDTFVADDLPVSQLGGAKIFHFGYPPLLRRLFMNEGMELESIFRIAKGANLLTSLDMSMPDPDSDSGKTDWPALLRRVLPHVDVFLPSVEEISFMLRKEVGTVSPVPSREQVRKIADWILSVGSAVAVIKLGEHGLYLKTTSDSARLQKTRLLDEAKWRNKELFSSCFEVNLIGATGSGDCTIAGFLAEILHGGTPEAAIEFATAVGACNVEEPDATGGIPSREDVLQRMASGWKKRAASI